jgi:GxxExxY protein
MNHQGTKTQRGPIHEDLDRVARVVVDAAFNVHSKLGPGLLESVYEVCLTHAIEKRGGILERQVALPIEYESDLRLACDWTF